MDKNMAEKVTMKILIPKYNEYPVEEAKKWAKRAYHQARIKVHWRKAKKIKQGLPIETADYAEKMTFIFWRLAGPAPGHPAKEAPLQVLLESLKSYVSNWRNFKQEFTYHLKKAFEVIHNSNYLPEMVKDRNKWINQVITKFVISAPSPHPSPSRGEGRERVIHLEFVPHPKTVESYNSPRFLKMRSRIWELYTDKPFDLTKYVPIINPIPGRPCQMEMHLDLSITESR